MSDHGHGRLGLLAMIPNLLPVFRRLQAAGLPLHVMVFSLADATALTAALEPRGLAIQHQPPDMTR